MAQFTNQNTSILSGGGLAWYFFPVTNTSNTWSPWGTVCLPFYVPCWSGSTHPNGGTTTTNNNDDNSNDEGNGDDGNSNDEGNGDDNNPPPPPPGDDNPPPPPPGDDDLPPPPSGDDNPPPDDVLEDLVNHSNSTPEPATLLLVASGLGGVGALARRRKTAPKA